MFLLCVIIAALAYALQNALLADYYRRMDQLSTVAYRGLSLALTMAPVLLFVPRAAFAGLPAVMVHISAAAVLALLGNWGAAMSFRYLPVGLSVAFCFSGATLITTLISYVLLGEVLTSLQAFFAITVLSAVMALALAEPHSTLQKKDLRLGVWYSLLFAIGLGAAYVGVGMAARVSDPLLVGYLWETVIGVLTLLLIGLLKPFTGKGLEPVSGRDLLKITVYSSPTVIGTALYAVATTMGPLGLLSALLSIEMVAAAVLGHLLYGEKLTRKQCILIVVICALVAALKIIE